MRTEHVCAGKAMNLLRALAWIEAGVLGPLQLQAHLVAFFAYFLLETSS